MTRSIALRPRHGMAVLASVALLALCAAAADAAPKRHTPAQQGKPWAAALVNGAHIGIVARGRQGGG